MPDVSTRILTKPKGSVAKELAPQQLSYLVYGSPKKGASGALEGLSRLHYGPWDPYRSAFAATGGSGG